MNLGKLLGAGKSFVCGNHATAYRADKRFYLPQFVSPKNPFTNSSAPPQVEQPKSEVKNSADPIRKTMPSTRVKTQKMPVFAAGGATARAATWVSKLNPISIFRGTASSANENMSPVQVELSLEKVKVVHNDLTDADVEIVPMKSRPAREPVVASLPAKKSWADLGERIMKVTAL